MTSRPLTGISLVLPPRHRTHSPLRPPPPRQAQPRHRTALRPVIRARPDFPERTVAVGVADPDRGADRLRIAGRSNQPDPEPRSGPAGWTERKSTRLNSSH